MTKTLTLRSFDIPALTKFGIGFDNMFDDLMRVNAQQSSTNYPPYDIVQVNDDEYMIAVAVAGFGYDDLSVTKDKKILVIEGKHSRETVENEDSTAKYLHKGISERSFRREFQLADHVEITGAHLELGILSINLKREVPEDAKPKTIAITYTSSSNRVNTGAAGLLPL
jgi:molecular chaperone IbpA